MSVVVYPHLAELLEVRGMTVAELERHIRARYGLDVNVKTLYRLTQAAPIQRADLEIAGAVAAILGVGLDDLFSVDAIAVDKQADMESSVLGPADSRRIAMLVEWQAQRLLTDGEWAELEELVGKYGQLLHQHRVGARARQRGISPEEEQRETEAQLGQALAEWRASDVEARQQALAALSAERPER